MKGTQDLAGTFVKIGHASHVCLFYLLGNILGKYCAKSLPVAGGSKIGELIIMEGFFGAVDKIKPLYDWVFKIIMFICKLLLIIDIGITTMAVMGRYISFIPDPAWSEEVVLTCMSYMAVLSAALAIRRGAHIRMTALDKYLPKKVIIVLDLLADIAVLALGVIMVSVGMTYAMKIGAKGTYVSMPWLSKFWQYFPIPLAGIVMIIFEVEQAYTHFKIFFVKEEVKA